MADSSRTPPDRSRPTPAPKRTLSSMDIMDQLRQLKENTARQFSGVQKDLTLLQGQYEKLQSDHTLLQTEHRELKQSTTLQFSEFSTHVAIVQHKYDKLQAEHHLLQIEHQKLRKDQNNLVKKHDQLHQNQDTVHGEHQSLQLYLDTFHEEHQSIVTDHQRLKEDVGKVNDVTQNMTSQLRQIAEEKDSRLESLHSKVAALENHGNRQEEMAALQDTVDQMHAEMQSLRNEVQKSGSEHDKMHAEMQSLRHDVEKSGSDLNQIHAEMQSLRSDVEKSGSDLNQMHAEMQSLRHDVEKSGSDLNQMHAELQSLRNDAKTSGSDLNQMHAELQSLRNDVEKSGSDLNQMHAELQSLRNDMNRDIQLVKTEQEQEIEGLKTGTLSAVAALKKKLREARPLFVAGRNADVLKKGDNPVPFPEVDYNHGGHFDGSAGRFTAPQPGVYFFRFSVRGVFREKVVEFFIKKDDGEIVRVRCRPSDYRSESVMVPLSAGRKVWMEFPESVDGTIGWSFKGTLVLPFP